MGDRVVVVGGGQAGFQTCASLRDNGFGGSLTLVCGEDVLPYQRPPLSKGYLVGTDEDIVLRPESYYAQHQIDMVNAVAVDIERPDREIVLDDGSRLSYDTLVLATGARPRALPVPGSRLHGILPLRTLADAEVLRKELAGCRRLAVIGGGFIGLEVAAAARKLDVETTVVESLPRTMARALSAEMSAYLTRVHRDHGATILLGRLVTAFDGDITGHVRKVVLDGGTRLETDLVVIGIGIVPNVELAIAAGLPVDHGINGIAVDEYLRTADPNIYAIGDCASYPSRYARGRVRLESVQNAADQGICVARTIAGQPAPYDALPWFWSDQHDVNLQICGISTGHDRAVIVGEPDRFSVFCFHQGTLIAVESANKPIDHVISRRVFASGILPTPDEVAAPGFSLKDFVSRDR
ncbi:MAG TPA: FAD-dependent oxidoreductase [Candidatus Limnocylindrales bacterium]|nr:FAD-dependent oxidoreductase [Candidatus Limnocylindrales bacterium]